MFPLFPKMCGNAADADDVDAAMEGRKEGWMEVCSVYVSVCVCG